MAALISVSWASEQTPLAGRPCMALWWASPPAASSLGSMAAPMAIILPMAFVMLTASAVPGLRL